MRAWRYSLLVAVLALASCKHDDAPKVTETPTATPVAAPAKPADPKPVAQKDPWAKEPAPKDPSLVLARPLLWAAAKDGKTTYFLGTMHLGVDAESRLPEIVWKDFDAAPSFAMETDLKSPEAAKMQTDMKRKKGTLHEELGPEYWKKLEDALGAPVAAQLDGMKTMVPATLLSMKGLPQTLPMDGVLREKAEGAHKKLVFLEDASKDEAILEKWMDAKALKEILDDLDGGEQRQKDMLAAYIAGDDQKLLALSDDEKKAALAHGYTAADYEAQMKDLLYDRNASWIPALEKLHKDGGGFVAVGAMHLIGPKSVLELLAKDGFTVTRVDHP